MIKPLILLDFDGVLFNSAYEAYQVCEIVASADSSCRKRVSFEDFMLCRAHLTDAWQFARLYHADRVMSDFRKLHEIEPDDRDWQFAKAFFAARAEMIKDPDWAKMMSPYPFFHQIRPLMKKYPETFKILSTRNCASIDRTLEFFEATGIEIFGQEDIRKWGSKFDVARCNGWFTSGQLLVYVDDMSSHLEPFEADVDMCIHAGWGYDAAHAESYTQGQAFRVIESFMRIVYE
jgi:hypothetical protein